MGLGISNAVIKYYPETDAKDGKRNNLLLFSFVLTLITSLILAVIILLFAPLVTKILIALEFDIELLNENKYAIFALGFVLVLVNTIIAYISNFGKISAPFLIKDLGIKIFLPILILLFFYKQIALGSISIYLIAFYFLILIVLTLYSFKRKIFYVDIRKSIAPYFRIKGLFSYLSFTSLTSLGAILAFRIDLIMIAPLLSLADNGIYAKILIIAAVIEIPVRVFTKTASPSISTFWHKEQKGEIRKLYKSTSNNSLVLASFLWLILIFNLDKIFSISSNPDSFILGFQIFLILSISKLIGVISGLSNTIISFSPSYKYNLYFLILLGILNVSLNYFMINTYGIIGAAYATVISTVIFHLLKVLFLFFKYGIHPFSINMLKTILISFVVCVAIYYIPNLDNPYLNIMLRSIIISLFFIPMILFFKASQDLNDMAKLYFGKLKSYL